MAWFQRFRARRTRAAAATVVGLSALAALGVSVLASRSVASGAVESSPSLHLTIGAIVSLTGSNSVNGPSTEKAIQMGAASVTAAAKKAGIDFQATVDAVDNQSDPVATVTAAQKLATDGSTCFVGASSSAATIAAATAVSIPQGIPIITPGSTSVTITPLHAQGGLTFRTIPTDPQIALALAKVVGESLHGAKGKLVAVAGRNDVYGQGMVSAFDTAWKASGGLVAGPLFYDPTLSNYDSQAQQLVSSSPRAYVVIDFPATYGLVASALLRTGKWSPNQTFIAGGYPPTIPSGIPPETLNGVTGVSPGFPLSGNLVAAFNALWAATPPDIQQQLYAQNAYDAAVLCSLAAIAAKSTTGTAIAAALPQVAGPHGPQFTMRTLPQAIEKLQSGAKIINYQGVSGPVDFYPNGNIRSTFVNVYRYVNGALKVTGVLHPTPHSK